MITVFRPSNFAALSECIHMEPEIRVTAEMESGLVMHEVIGEFLRGFLLPPEKATPEPWNQFPLSVREQLKWIWSEFMGARKLKLERVEEEIPILDELGGEIVRGHLDARFSTPEGEPYIVDWKSGQGRDYSPQLKAYALGVMDKLGVQHCLTALAYPEEGAYYQNRIEYATAANFVHNLALEFELKRLPHKISRYCEWCVHNGKCPAWLEQANRALTVTGTLAAYTPIEIDKLKNDPVRLEDFLLLYERLKQMIEKDWALKEALMTHSDTGYKLENFTKISVDPKIEEILSVDPEKFLSQVARALGVKRSASLIKIDVPKAQAAWQEFAPEKEFPLKVHIDIVEKKGYSYLRRKVK